MALGFDVYEDTRDFQKKGITDEIRRYVTDKMGFPCFIIVASEEKPVEMYKVSVLRKTFSSIAATLDEESIGRDINIYFSQGDRTAMLGKIQPRQVKSFLKLFEYNEVHGYLDKDTPLEGQYMYVLSE